MKKIKLMADYECYPLWLDFDDEIGNINPNTLPISDSLKNELKNWTDDYDKTLNLDDPLHSGFKTTNDEITFKERGKILQKKLQTELSNSYEVIYQP
ncbi:hypothetical protein PT286_03550 [Neisseriaceae bacterium ESL0693]|nr:hypothetical protein [Neisseriaceae bacterium ESL0693]